MVPCPCPSGFRQLACYVGELLTRSLDDPLRFSFQLMDTVGAWGRFACSVVMHRDIRGRILHHRTVRSSPTQ